MFASVVPGYSSAKHRKNRGSLPTFLWQAGQKDSRTPFKAFDAGKVRTQHVNVLRAVHGAWLL